MPRKVRLRPLCTENLIRVDEVMESPKLAEWSGCSVSFLPSRPRHSSRSCGLKPRTRCFDISWCLKGWLQVASGSRTMIAVSLSSCIADFHQSCRFSQSSSPRRSCVGTGPAFVATGVGSRAQWEGPQIEAELRGVIRRMSMENPLWGAPRVHGELLKLGFAVARSLARFSRPVW